MCEVGCGVAQRAWCRAGLRTTRRGCDARACRRSVHHGRVHDGLGRRHAAPGPAAAAAAVVLSASVARFDVVTPTSLADRRRPRVARQAGARTLSTQNRRDDGLPRTGAAEDTRRSSV